MVYSQNNLQSTYFDDISQASIICSQPHKASDYSKKINAKTCSLILFSLNASFHYPRTYCSTIPTFHYSNCERSELITRLGEIN